MEVFVNSNVKHHFAGNRIILIFSLRLRNKVKVTLFELFLAFIFLLISLDQLSFSVRINFKLSSLFHVVLVSSTGNPGLELAGACPFFLYDCLKLSMHLEVGCFDLAPWLDLALNAENVLLLADYLGAVIDLLRLGLALA